MRKTLSILLAAMLIISMMPVFAQDDMTSGEKLQEAGFIDGDPDGSLNEDRLLIRAEATKLVVEMYDSEEEALMANLTPSYSDVPEAWFTPYIGYAELMDWVNGYPDGTFLPYNTITSKEWTTMLINVLGYPYTWDNVVAVAASQGIYVNAENPDAITRGEAFDAMWQAVWTPPYGSDVPLGVLLGRFPANPEELEVQSVNTSNLVQTMVTFNQKVAKDTAENIDNYDLEDSSDKDVTVYSADLQSDGMTVILSHHSFEQQATAELIISGVKSEDGTKMMATETFDIYYLDQTIPEVESIQVIGSNKIKVIFSEPMNNGYELNGTTTFSGGNSLNTNDFEVINNNSTMYISSDFIVQNNNTEVIIDLYSDLELGDVEVTVKSGIEDYAGFSVVPYTVTLDVVEDTEAPYITGYEKAELTKVTLIWNEDIRLIHGAGDSQNNLFDSDGDPYFYHTNSNNAASSVAVDGNKLILTFAEADELPQGTGYVYVATDSVEDYYRNEANQQMIEVQVELDTTPPSVKSYDIDNTGSRTVMTIKFSEEMNVGTVEELDNYDLLDNTGDNVTSSYLSSDNDFEYFKSSGSNDPYVKIYFDNKLNGNYSLVLSNLEDLAGNEMNHTISFDANDQTAPNPSDWTATYYPQPNGDQLIVIDYNKSMSVDGPYSVINYDNYIIDGKALSDYEDGVSFNATENNSMVEITVRDSSNDGFDLDFNSNPSIPIIIGRVSDANGNLTVNYSNTIYVSGTTDKLTFTSEVLSPDQIKIKFTTIVDFEPSDLEFYFNGVTLGDKIASLDQTIDSNNTIVTFTFDNDYLPYDAVFDSDPSNMENGSVYVDTVSNPQTDDQYGNTLKADYTVSAVDKAAPAVKKDVNSKYIVYGYDTDSNDYLDTIMVEYTENLDRDYISFTTYLVSGGVVESITVVDSDNPTTSSGVEFGKFIKIVINDDSGDRVEFDESYTSLADLIQQYSVYDKNGNALYPNDQPDMPIMPKTIVVN